jgi:hypothetical protein
MQRTLAGTALRLENQRHRNKVMARGKVAKQKHVKELVEVIQRTKDRLTHDTDRTISSGERARHLEEMTQVKQNGNFFLLACVCVCVCVCVFVYTKAITSS